MKKASKQTAIQQKPPPPQQTVVASIEVAGLGVGVLEDGTAFVNGRALATLCGTAASTIIWHSHRWRDGHRDSPLAAHLLAHGVPVDLDSLYIETRHKNREIHAYPDAIVLFIMEFYASENSVARLNHLKLSGHGLREHIYEQTGYQSKQAPEDQWRHVHARLEIHELPCGYFSVFKETVDFVIASIRAGLRVDEHTVPDGSVGIAWSKYWEESRLASQHERIRYEHNYPDFFPQSDSNPQLAWAYPYAVLGIFRTWLEREYLPQRYPRYLVEKVRGGMLAEGTARQVLAAVRLSPDALPAIPPPRKPIASTKPKALPPGAADQGTSTEPNAKIATTPK